MNVLIIGNGFDLAHGLPTKYSDFVNAVLTNSDFFTYLKNSLRCKLDCFERVRRSSVFRYVSAQVHNNKGWIDFEFEIKRLVDGMCEFKNLLSYEIKDIDGKICPILSIETSKISSLLPEQYYIIFDESTPKIEWTEKEIEEIKKNLHNQIVDFIQLFQEYIIWVERRRTPFVKMLPFFTKLSVNRLLSFNYTQTFPKLYRSNRYITSDKCCYVHGIVSRRTNARIVMGIGSDYYDPSKHEDFLDLFKFFQRYKYNTSTTYQNWLLELSAYPSPSQNIIYIFGHSLDPTDRDILLPFFKAPNTKMVIYYYSDGAREQLEKILLRILGKDDFTQYLIGEQRKIEFQPIN